MEMQKVKLKYGTPGWGFFNAATLYENFSGRETEMNNLGDRNFCVVIDKPEYVDLLRADGFNVKEVKKYDLNEPDKWALKIHFNLDKDSSITGVDNGQKVPYSNATVGLLDNANIDFVDITIRKWEYKPGKFSARLDGGMIYLIPSVLDQRFKERYPETVNPDAIGPSEFDDDDYPFSV